MHFMTLRALCGALFPGVQNVQLQKMAKEINKEFNYLIPEIH